MGFFDGPKDTITLAVIAGQKNFDGAVGFSGLLTLKQHPSGAVYTSGKNGPQVYMIVGYEWDGPEYKSVTTTNERTVSRGAEKSRTKRTGRVAGAVAGTLIAPGFGTVIGAMVGTGNKKGEARTKGTATRTGTTSTQDVETSSTAFMTLRNIKTNETFTFSFKCDSKINVDVTNMLHKANLL